MVVSVWLPAPLGQRHGVARAKTSAAYLGEAIVDDARLHRHRCRRAALIDDPNDSIVVRGVRRRGHKCGDGDAEGIGAVIGKATIAVMLGRRTPSTFSTSIEIR